MIGCRAASEDLSRLGCLQVCRFRSRIPRPAKPFALFHFDELQAMKQKSSSRNIKTNLRRLRSMTESGVRILAEHPEFDLRHVARGIVRRGLKVVPAKASVSLRIDADVLEWFKSGGAGYQTRMNAVLRAFKEAAG
jgi:uncharacterized protein (DUF4415 family)